MGSAIAPHKDVSIHLVGKEALLLQAERGDLIRLNPAAAYIWCCLKDGLELDGIISEYKSEYSRSEQQAQQEICLTFKQFGDHGLLANGAVDAVAPRPEPAVRSRPPRSKSPERRGPHHGLQILGTKFHVYYASADLRDAVEEVMTEFARPDPNCDMALDVVWRAGGYAIFVDGQEIETGLSVAELIPHVKCTLLVAAINRIDFGAYFHAAVLSIGDERLLLPGPAGSGKTCLTLALTFNGFGYVSDETALLEMETMHIRAVPLSPCVKSGAWDVMSTMYPILSKLKSYQRVDGKTVKYLPVPAWQGHGSRDTARPARWIVFPTYSPKRPTELRRVDRIDALQRLVQDCNAWRAPLTPQMVDRVIAWISGVTCYELCFSSLEEAVKEITGLCGIELSSRNNRRLHIL
jgi:coenzyme PQQ synthesis protein D (PqqD)